MSKKTKNADIEKINKNNLDKTKNNLNETKNNNSQSDVVIQMQKLAEEIRKHQYFYYIENNPKISDLNFDELLYKLQKLENEYPNLILPDTPTKLIGSDLNQEFTKEKHSIPVLSLKNTYNINELLDWANKIKENNQTKFLIQWKIDGATLVLYYKKGILDKAVTRGSGDIGDNVTQNAFTIKNIPYKLSDTNIDIIVRGEVFMYYSDFEEYNESFGSIYANPRNLVSGTLKSKKSSEVAQRPLRFIGYDTFIQNNLNNNSTDTENLLTLKKLGLPTNPDNQVVSFENLEKTILEFESKRAHLDIPVDGLVVKIDALHLRENLGYTSNAPRWAVAYKFVPEEGITTVLKIETFVGRTGRVTPRATLKQINLSGTKVEHATLHNADYIEKKKIRVGSKVKVTKRGEIIPAIEEVVEQSNEAEFIFPKNCPTCNTKLSRPLSQVDYECPNLNCKGRILQNLIFFCGKKQMDINGLGEKVCETFFNLGYIKNIPDIYKLYLHKNELEKLEGFGKKSIESILNGIEKSKEKSFACLLVSLGLNEIGPNVANLLIENGYESFEKIKKLVAIKDFEDKIKTLTEIETNEEKKSFSKLDKLFKLYFPNLYNIHGIGITTALSIVKQFHEKIILDIFEELEKLGLNLFHKKDYNLINNKLEGQTWCVTGTFENFKPRDLALLELKKRGAKISSTITTTTTHLLAGAMAGSKLEKAEKLNIKIINEEEFLKIIQN